MTTRIDAFGRCQAPRSCWTLALVALVLSVALGSPPPSLAQGQEHNPDESELREAMQRFFENRVRAELALTDAQIDHILPRVRRSEELRREARRQRQKASRELQRGMKQGAGDDELQRLLDAVEGIEEQQRLKEREILTEIDSVLSVRQRVQFRVFTQRFREELQRRMRELQGGPNPRQGRRFRRP